MMTARDLSDAGGWHDSRFVELRREAEHELVLENLFILKRHKPQLRYVKKGPSGPPPSPLDVRALRPSACPRSVDLQRGG